MCQTHLSIWFECLGSAHPELNSSAPVSPGFYKLTFRVRVTTTPQCGRNASSIGASILSSPACVVRAACGGPGGLPLGSATHFWCCHSSATRAPIRNPPNSAQLGGIPATPPSYIRIRAIVWACGRGQTHTDVRDHNTFRVDYTTQREM